MQNTAQLSTVRETLPAHLGDVRLWCLLKTRDVHLADDVAQGTALVALARLDCLRDPERVRGWLFQIARRRLFDEIRMRHHTAPLNGEPLAREENPEPERRALLAMRVRLAVRALPRFLRRPVRMHYFKGRTLEDVAERLKTSVGGVKTRLWRARRLLREGGTL